MLAYVADTGGAVAAEYEVKNLAYEGVVQWTCGDVFVAFGAGVVTALDAASAYFAP